MIRRNDIAKYRYTFEKGGSFGVFKSNSSLPIEFILTSFDIDELNSLSFARDIKTQLNFDYLIQRDIDEERSIGEISQYLLANEDKLEKEAVFLPPLLVAIVGVDSNEEIEEEYPDVISVEVTDEVGDVLVREWPALFKVENYYHNRGLDASVIDHNRKEKKVDIESSKLYLNISTGNSPGARLVVIDGQHRLFALKYLKETNRAIVSNLITPVCIVFPGEIPDHPKANIPQTLRGLFVDVNSTVERVSGHFLTLLSDQTLGSIICREFCKFVLDKKGIYGLGLVEWNIKKHKESLEISREHSITSIGVINSALDENFKTKNGVKILSYLLGVSDEFDNTDFTEDIYEDAAVIPEYFPWRDFNSKHKEKLTELVVKNIIPGLLDIFFENKCFREYVEHFQNIFVSIEAKLTEDKSPDLYYLDDVKEHFLLNKSCKNEGKSLAGCIKKSLDIMIRDKVPEILRKSLFQKAMIDAWVIISTQLILNKKEHLIASKILNCYIDMSFEDSAYIFDPRNLYSQDTIYSGTKIKVTRTSKKQLMRLILAQGIHLSGFDSEVQSIMYELAKKEIINYIDQMTIDKRKVFEKSYRTNFSLQPFEREQLAKAEDEKNNTQKSIRLSNTDSQFYILVTNAIRNDINGSYESLMNVLNLNQTENKKIFESVKINDLFTSSDESDDAL